VSEHVWLWFNIPASPLLHSLRSFSRSLAWSRSLTLTGPPRVYNFVPPATPRAAQFCSKRGFESVGFALDIHMVRDIRTSPRTMDKNSCIKSGGVLF